MRWPAQLLAVDAKDFGPDGFREGRGRNLAAFYLLSLKPEGRTAVTGRIVCDLANRLRTERWYKDHPETDTAEIQGPVLVCSLPRM